VKPPGDLRGGLRDKTPPPPLRPPRRIHTGAEAFGSSRPRFPPPGLLTGIRSGTKVDAWPATAFSAAPEL
jgi:hypothetical protein